MSKAEQPEFDLSTSAGGRGYVAHLFTATLKRYDFASYIKEHLAADFACTLAAHLAQAEAAALVRETELQAENHRLREGMKGDYDLDAWLDWAITSAALRKELEVVKKHASFWYTSSGEAIDAMTTVAGQRDALQLRLNASEIERKKYFDATLRACRISAGYMGLLRRVVESGALSFEEGEPGGFEGLEADICSALAHPAPATQVSL